MKKSIYIFVCTFFLVSMLSCAKGFKGSGISELKTDKEKTGYAVGQNIGNSLREAKGHISMEALVAGMNDAMDKRKALLTREEANALMASLGKKITEENRKKAEINLAKGIKYLKANRKKKGVVETPSGLQYKVIQKGSGRIPTADDTVKVHYRGSLIDGTEFDSSYSRNEPTVFNVGRVIAGWTEALQLMPEGSKYLLTIPSNLAYGENPSGKEIGPNSVLIFEVELLEILK